MVPQRDFLAVVRVSVLLFGAVLVMVLGSASAYSQPTCEIPFEAYLTDLSDDPIADDTVDVQLNFYRGIEESAFACREGAAVPVDAGWIRMSVDVCEAVGSGDCSGDALSVGFRAAVDAGEAIYLGVEINDEGELDELIPVGAVPFAVFASEAATAADATQLAGEPATAYARTGDIPDVSDYLTNSG